MSVTLHLLPERYAVCRLGAAQPVPAWLPEAGTLVAVVRTSHELSVVCDERAVPQELRAERGFRALEVAGTLAFDAVGIMAAISGVLAAANIPLLAVSTFDTDYVLVRAPRLNEAVQALRAFGHTVVEPPR